MDIFQLSSLQFEEITINLIDPLKKARRKITVTNSQESSSPFSVSNIFKYKVGNNTYTISINPDARIRRSVNEREIFARYLSSEVRREYSALKKEISSLVEVSQISVYRQVSNEVLEVDPRQRVTAVDERLQQLFERFARYQLKLETQLNERLALFQQEVLGSLLYNEEFDEFKHQKLNEVSEIDLKMQEDKLSKAFRELGMVGKSEQISNHINRLRNALEALNKTTKTNSISVDDVIVVPLIYRTNKIIDLLNESEEDKRKIVESRQKFLDTLQDFMPNKNFQYDNKRGVLIFSLESVKDDLFPWTSLSSGEKQLLIQFMEVILQEGRSLIFIADEPELSLHIIWQEKLLKALRDLNINAQLIVATHSPDIVADFNKNIINMEKVVSVNV